MILLSKREKSLSIKEFKIPHFLREKRREAPFFDLYRDPGAEPLVGLGGEAPGSRGLGSQPQVGSRGEALVGGMGGEAPRKIFERNETILRYFPVV